MSERNPPPDPSEPGRGTDPPYRARTVDARAMKAFAHPLRMAMYDYLNDHGSATATMLARSTGESTGQTSYHLRQLERHGFVQEVADRGTGRERWWRAVGFSMEGGQLAKDASTRPAVVTTLQHQTSRRAETIRDWFLRAEKEPEEWQRASVNNRTTMLLSAHEAAELSTALMELVHEHLERARARHGDGDGGSEDGALRRVRLYLDVFPLPQDPG